MKPGRIWPSGSCFVRISQDPSSSGPHRRIGRSPSLGQHRHRRGLGGAPRHSVQLPGLTAASRPLSQRRPSGDTSGVPVRWTSNSSYRGNPVRPRSVMAREMADGWQNACPTQRPLCPVRNPKTGTCSWVTLCHVVSLIRSSGAFGRTSGVCRNTLLLLHPGFAPRCSDARNNAVHERLKAALHRHLRAILPTQDEGAIHQAR